MAKSDKSTVLRRVHDVLRLVVAGAEFTDIRQYASDKGWDVSERQIRRYLEAPYKRLAGATKRNRNQLLGRHLMQRRALYARSLKGNDLRTALQVLRDDAALEGLYPPTKIAPTTPDGQHAYPGPEGSPLTRRQRLVRLVAAEARNDKTELRLVEHATPTRLYRFPDTMLPLQLLHIMALIYINEQLEQASMLLHALLREAVEDDADGSWDLIAHCSAYRFHIGREAWLQFAQEAGFDADYLVKANSEGVMLDLCGDNICQLAPTAEELKGVMEKAGHSVEEFQTAHNLAKSWRRLLAQICPVGEVAT
jgi:hypothetical protein